MSGAAGSFSMFEVNSLSILLQVQVTLVDDFLTVRPSIDELDHIGLNFF
jgi:hypothetical protein